MIKNKNKFKKSLKQIFLICKIKYSKNKNFFLSIKKNIPNYSIKNLHKNIKNK
jgi:hypothetical protein